MQTNNRTEAQNNGATSTGKIPTKSQIAMAVAMQWEATQGRPTMEKGMYWGRCKDEAELQARKQKIAEDSMLWDNCSFSKGQWTLGSNKVEMQYVEMAIEKEEEEIEMAEVVEVVEVVAEVVAIETAEVVEVVATTTTRIGTKRANRVAISATETGAWKADFYKTHDLVGSMESDKIGWVSTAKTTTGQREEFREFATTTANTIGVQWQPELQQQAWDRKFWKYENDSQVEIDAIELMAWTIRDICGKLKLESNIESISLDSIVPNTSNLSYVENGRYTKNGNWSSAVVNLEVTMTDETIIIYPIEMVSGQLKKIKLTKEDIKGMMEDGMVA